jgi:uncharacterized membrane protein
MSSLYIQLRFTALHDESVQIYLCNRQVLTGSLFGWLSFAIYGPCVIIFMTVCVYYFRPSRHS